MDVNPNILDTFPFAFTFISQTLEHLHAVSVMERLLKKNRQPCIQIRIKHACKMPIKQAEGRERLVPLKNDVSFKEHKWGCKGGF